MMSNVDFSNENILFESFKQGNNQAFEYLFKGYYARLQLYVLRFVNDREVVKDIIQECFIKLWKKHKSVKCISITSLLFVMVRNSCLNYLKHCTVVNNYKLEHLAGNKGEERLYHADFICDTEQILLYEELQKEINQVIDLQKLK